MHINDIGLVGTAFALAWLLCGFYTVGYLENRASRERIPKWLFPWLELLALVLGPVILVPVWIDTTLSGGISGWWKEAQDKRNRVDLTIVDSRGQEMGYLDPDCLKCGKCTLACPSKIMTLKH